MTANPRSDHFRRDTERDRFRLMYVMGRAHLPERSSPFSALTHVADGIRHALTHCKASKHKELIMNRKQRSVVLASLLALALAGCSTTGGSDTGGGATGSGTGSSGGGSMGSGSGASGTSGSMGSGTSAPSGSATSEGSSGGGMAGTGSAGAASQQAGQTPSGTSGAMGSQTAMPNAVVTVIEVVPHAGDGSAAVGSSGTTGATGSSATREKMYRITLRMDDGTTRVVTQDKAPTFRNGDRVNMTDGVITQ
jgi:hypothetical protein